MYIQEQEYSKIYAMLKCVFSKIYIKILLQVLYNPTRIDITELKIMFMGTIPKAWRAPLGAIIEYCVDMLKGMFKKTK